MSLNASSQVDFKHIFESAPALFLVLNPKLEIVAVSDAYLQATLTQRENILGKNIFTVFPDNPDDKTATGTANLRSSLEQVIKTKAPDTMAVQKYDIPRPAISGGGFDVKYWSPFNTPVLNSTGELQYIIHRVEDVTDFLLLKEKGVAQEKQLELELYQRAQELQRTNKRLRAAEQMKSEFLATMSHEIRTPMNGIVGMTEMLLMTSLNSDQKAYAQIIQESTMSLMTIINDILDFSKIEAGKIELEAINFSLIQTVENQADLLSAKYKAKGLSLTTYVDPEIPFFLKGDPGRVGQVLLNLISNAIKFTSVGSIFVQAQLLKDSTTDLKKGPLKIRFSVTDTGIGIAADVLPQLFQPFVQGDSSMSRRFGGTGLGLSISKKLVNLMQGDMGVESEKGKGSCFWFTLPFMVGEQPIEDLSHQRSSLRNLRVLVAEEDAIAREVLLSYIHSWGAKSDGATNTAECLEMLNRADVRKLPYDLVFIGLGTSSLEIARKISLHPHLKNIKKVLMDDYRQPLSEQAILESGFRARVTKPFKQSQIFDCIVSITDGRNQIRPDIAIGNDNVPEKVTPNKGVVLVVEDNLINQKVAQSMLEMNGYNVVIAATGEEAIQLHKLSDYDLILMDCQMPVMDGFEATKLIRQMSDPQKSQIPIVAVTANAMKDDDEKCIQAGMNDYISKPIDNELLALKVAQWIRRPAN